MGTLYLVATPIGNLEDMSPRGLRVMREARLIAAEDTRHTGLLLARHAIRKTLVSYHEFNEAKRSEELIELCCFPAGGPVQVQPDLTHLAFEVDSLEEFGQHLQASARQLEPALDGLVGVRHTAQGNDLGDPAGRGQLLAQQPGRVLFDHDLRFEIQPGRKAEVFVRGPGVAVDAAMFAAAIGI